MKHHLGAPFVFSREVSEGLSLRPELDPPSHLPIKWSVYAGSEHTVNNERVMQNMKLYSRSDTLHLSFLDHTNPFVPSQSRSNSKITKPLQRGKAGGATVV